MNWALVFSLVRNIAPPILTYVAGRYPDFAGPIMNVIAVLGTGGAAAWGATTHTDSGKIAAVEAIPEVQRIVVARTATNGVAAAVADTSRPKVVSQ